MKPTDLTERECAMIGLIRWAEENASVLILMPVPRLRPDGTTGPLSTTVIELATFCPDDLPGHLARVARL